MVIGTTGWLDEMDRVRAAVERHGTGLVWSPNFSIGVNVFFRVVREAARLLRIRAAVRRMGLGDSSSHQERRAFRNAAEAGGGNESRRLFAPHRHQLQPRGRASGHA